MLFIQGIKRGQNPAGKRRFWHERGREATIRAETLCGESCAPQDASRMPRLPKKVKNPSKTEVLAIFGPQALSGPISALFPGVGRALRGGAKRYCPGTTYVRIN